MGPAAHSGVDLHRQPCIVGDAWIHVHGPWEVASERELLRGAIEEADGGAVVTDIVARGGRGGDEDGVVEAGAGVVGGEVEVGEGWVGRGGFEIVLRARGREGRLRGGWIDRGREGSGEG